jgi:hypothetical protein
VEQQPDAELQVSPSEAQPPALVQTPPAQLFSQHCTLLVQAAPVARHTEPVAQRSVLGLQ